MRTPSPSQFPGAPLLLAAAFALQAAAAGTQPAPAGYRKPPAAVQAVLDAPPPPRVSIGPTGRHAVLVEWSRYPSISRLARPWLGLAGYRFDPETRGDHLPSPNRGFSVKSIPAGPLRKIVTPPEAELSLPVWSPDGRRFAFTVTTNRGIEAWVADAEKAMARPLRRHRLNAILMSPIQWLPGGQLLLATIPGNGGRVPELPDLTPTPGVQESDGSPAPTRTFQDLLRSPADARLFAYYAASQLVAVEPETGRAEDVGKPGLYDSVAPDASGSHLLVSRLKEPFSFQLPAGGFPQSVEVWDGRGRLLHRVADLPSWENVPIGGVLPGPRAVHWIPVGTPTLAWAEALDGGDPRKPAPHRDVVRVQAAPFREQPRDLMRLQHRFTGMVWDEAGAEALVSEFDRDRLQRRTFLIDGSRPGTEPRLLWDLPSRDRYRDPGTPVMRTLPSGRRAIRREGDYLFLIGEGASPQGDRPFLDRLELSTLKTERLFHCAEGVYESVELLRDDNALITRRESPTEPPNYYLRVPGKPDAAPITAFNDPSPQLRKIKKQLVTYRRADGVPLSFTLYLPPDFQEGQRLPTLVWAYPREFGDAATAGQVTGSPHRFTTIAGISHLFFALHGYAVLDGASMPVVGPPQTVNETFLEQIVAGARAAVEKADEMGVSDPKRVGVGGHSYGAFMTANLLAHSDLFRAGIARSGAYNRTLTPFGFQSERRTFWEAPDFYFRVSPFMHAQKINEPLLLIHGEADDNSGTFPIQSERLFQALKGNGARARFVSLPHESHGYIARESVEHTLAEMLEWFDRWVKGTSP